MPLELWLAFVLASTLLLVIPGPTVMLVVGQALAAGRRSAWATVPGVGLGDLTAMTLSVLGLGAVLAASATLFTAVKLTGAAYLVWLGLQLWRSSPSHADAQPQVRERRPRAMFLEAYTVTALNPKSIVFFVAFVPQFLTAGAPLLPQLVILVATFVLLAMLNAVAFALLAGSVRGSVQRPAVRLWLDRLGGAVLIGAGAMVAAWRRAA
jgi:threonine/homoserine/homoserine lactone efflux protein